MIIIKFSLNIQNATCILNTVCESPSLMPSGIPDEKYSLKINMTT
jgi:hypothetical protein